jgi:hypothetical protein
MNEYGQYGSEYSSLSPFNDYTSSPPAIVQRGIIIGYLTTNRYVLGAVSTYDFLGAYFAACA